MGLSGLGQCMIKNKTKQNKVYKAHPSKLYINPTAEDVAKIVKVS
jgi:hypothetical protein